MKNKIRNWILLILGLIGGGTGTYFISQPSTTKTSSEVTTLEQRIDVTTTDSPLVISVGTNLVDICFQGTQKKKERDLLDPSFQKLQSGLGFMRGAYPSVGFISVYNHYKSSGGTGYNFVQSNFPSKKDYENYAGGVCCGWNFDFATNSKEFTESLGIPCDICLNIKNGSWKEDKAFIDAFNPEYIYLQSESNIDKTWSIDGYIKSAKPIRDSIMKYYPTKKIVIDCAPVFKEDRNSLEWNKKLYPAFATQYGGRFYILGDYQETYTGNQDSNVIRVNDFIDNVMVRDMGEFRKVFPGWKMCVGQMLTEENRALDGSEIRTHINGGIVGILLWGRIYETIIKNQDLIPVAYQMSDKNLVSGDSSDVNYQVIKLLNQFIKSGKTLNKVAFQGMTGLTGVEVSDGKKHFLLINNSSKTSYTLQNLYLDSVKTRREMVFTTKSQYSQDWKSDIKNTTITTTGTFTVPQCSVSVLSFTKK